MNTAAAPTVEDLRSGRSTLRFGLSGEGVRRVHRLLGMDEAELYCAATHQAVTRFQRAHGLPTNGQVDQTTFAKLEEHAQLADEELSPLTQKVREILASTEYGRDDKIARIWKAFTESAPEDYAEVISALKDNLIERRSKESWVGLLLRYASKQVLDKDKASPPFSALAKAVIREDESACREAYGLLPGPLKRSLLDEKVYEDALFAVAARPRWSGQNLSFMKELVRIRFPHVMKIERWKRGSPEWSANLLKKVYDVMRELPPEHLTQIQGLFHDGEKASDRIENGLVGGEFDAGTGSLVARDIREGSLEVPGMEKADLFKFNLRHEIGHAVDKLLWEINLPNLDPEVASNRGDLNLYSRLPNVSQVDWGWLRYQNARLVDARGNFDVSSPQASRWFPGMVQEMMANAGDPEDRVPPAALSLGEFVKLLFLMVNNTSDHDVFLAQLISQKKISDKQLRKNQVYQALKNEEAFKRPFGKDAYLPAETTFGDRVFVRPSEVEFASFSARAFHLRVRNYGARSPAEWFAETYAFYHDALGRDVLKGKHPGAITYLEALLRRFRLPLAK
jgi:hypothetical protein